MDRWYTCATLSFLSPHLLTFLHCSALFIPQALFSLLNQMSMIYLVRTSLFCIPNSSHCLDYSNRYTKDWSTYQQHSHHRLHQYRHCYTTFTIAPLPFFPVHCYNHNLSHSQQLPSLHHRHHHCHHSSQLPFFSTVTIIHPSPAGTTTSHHSSHWPPPLQLLLTLLGSSARVRSWTTLTSPRSRWESMAGWRYGPKMPSRYSFHPGFIQAWRIE